MHSSAPLVSVIIPCYNQGHFLSQSIESVLSQTYREVEGVVVDDGSGDDTVAVAARYPGLHCVRQQNKGVGEARNAGFRASNGDYIIFLDADDRLTPIAVEAHLSCFADHPEAGFVVGDIDHIGVDGSYAGSPRWPMLDANQYEELLKANHVANTIAVMFRRSVIERVGGFSLSRHAAEDYELLLHAARLFPSAHHRTAVAQYRRYPVSLSGQGVVMLRGMHLVMRLQRPTLKANPRLVAAWRQGGRYWRDHFGMAAIKQIYAHLQRGELWRAVSVTAGLLRYVRGRLFVLPWKYRKRVLRYLRRQRAAQKQEDTLASNVISRW